MSREAARNQPSFLQRSHLTRQYEHLSLRRTAYQHHVGPADDLGQSTWVAADKNDPQATCGIFSNKGVRTLNKETNGTGNRWWTNRLVQGIDTNTQRPLTIPPHRLVWADIGGRENTKPVDREFTHLQNQQSSSWSTAVGLPSVW